MSTPPPESWRWGGPGWQGRARTDVVRAITGVTLGAADPARLAVRWTEVLGLAPAWRVGDALELALDPGTIRFVAAGDRGDEIVAVALATTHAARALATAREGGLATSGRSISIGGVRFDLE